MPVREFKDDKYELTDLASANVEGLGLYINFIVQKLDELIGAFNEIEERVIDLERKFK